MVIVPVRWVLPELGATLNATVVVPVPDAEDVTVIHGALLDTDHGHPVPVVRLTLPVVASLETEVDDAPRT